MDQLNNREIATLLWGFITIITIFILSLTKKELFLSLKQLFSILFNIKIISPIFLIFLYTIGLASILNILTIWEYTQLKNTIFWFFTFAVGTLFQLNSIRKDSNNFFRDTLTSLLSLTIFLQFIINFHTFGFLIEFVIIIPTLTILSILSASASKNENHKNLKKIIDLFLSIIALFFIINFTINFVQNPKFFLNNQTLKDFFIPVLLTIFYLPAFWLLLLYVQYEEIFVRLHFFIKNKKLINLSKLLVIINFRYKKDLLESWFDHIKIHPISNSKELYKSIKLIRERKAKEKSPSIIPLQIGWAPHKAKAYLKEFNLTVGYKDIGDEIWFGSKVIELNDSFSPPSLSYYIEGQEIVVKQLKLSLFLHHLDGVPLYLNTYIETINHLLIQSLNINLNENQKKMIIKKTNFTVSFQYTEFQFNYEEFSNTQPTKCKLSIYIRNIN